MQKKTNNNRKGNISNKPNSGGRGKNVGKNSNDNSKNYSNDPSWYSADPTIMRDAANIPYSLPGGAPIKLAGHSSDTTFTIPGVMAYELAPTIGYSDSITDPINMAATQSYTFIRHANSGSANYDSSDIMLYYLAMADVYSYIEYLRRMYGVVQVFAQRNKYIPYTLLRAMKVNPYSLINNMANFRLGLNMLINKAASFAVPNTMSLFPRRQFLYSGIYTEGSSIRDQLYLFVPNGFHLYNWKEGKTDYMRLSDTNISSLLGYDPVFNDGMFDAMSLIEVGHRMIDLLINNEDMGIMNGDIIKAYGDNILKLSHLSEDYAIAPVYDPYVLEQMQNASIIPEFGNGFNTTAASDSPSSSLDITSSYITEEANVEGMAVLISRPVVQHVPAPLVDGSDLTTQFEDNLDVMKNMVHASSHMITTMLSDPEPKDNMEITRLAACLIKHGDDDNVSYRLSSGSEVCVGCKVYIEPYDGSNVEKDNVEVFQFSFDGKDFSGWAKEVTGVTYSADVLQFAIPSRSLKYLNAYKFRPHVYYHYFMSTLEGWKNYSATFKAPKYVSGQLSNYTIMHNEILDKLHGAAMMSEFATPHIALKQV